jgi:hypothetical protein
MRNGGNQHRICDAESDFVTFRNWRPDRSVRGNPKETKVREWNVVVTVERVIQEAPYDQLLTQYRPDSRGIVRVDALESSRGIGRRIVVQSKLEGSITQVRLIVCVAKFPRRRRSDLNGKTVERNDNLEVWIVNRACGRGIKTPSTLA